MSKIRVDQAEELQLRVLRVLDIASLLGTEAFDNAHTEFEDFIDSGMCNTHQSVKALHALLAGVEQEDVHAKLYAGAHHGFLLQVGTPVRKYFADDMCSYSWGHFYTGWVYGQTYEGAWQQAMDWAKERAAADLATVQGNAA